MNLPKPIQAYGIYLGKRKINVDDLDVLPYFDFMRALWSGNLIN